MSYSAEHVLLCSAVRVRAELNQVCLAVLLTTEPKLKTCRGTSSAEHASFSLYDSEVLLLFFAVVWITLESVLLSGKERPLQHSEQMHTESAFKAFNQV